MKKPLKKSGPNSWGKTCWNNCVRQMKYDKEIDVQNGVKKRSFIRQFLVTHITGVKLQNTLPHSKNSMTNSYRLIK